MEDASASYCDHNENSLTIDISHLVCARVFFRFNTPVCSTSTLLAVWYHK